jgi:hypothetical protein
MLSVEFVIFMLTVIIITITNPTLGLTALMLNVATNFIALRDVLLNVVGPNVVAPNQTLLMHQAMKR